MGIRTRLINRHKLFAERDESHYRISDCAGLKACLLSYVHTFNGLGRSKRGLNTCPVALVELLLIHH